jgi:hypothetical protein
MPLFNSQQQHDRGVRWFETAATLAAELLVLLALAFAVVRYVEWSSDAAQAEFMRSTTLRCLIRIIPAKCQVRSNPLRAEPLARGKVELLHNAEVNGFRFCYVVRVYAGQGRSSSGSSMNPWLSTTLPFCVIGT